MILLNNKHLSRHVLVIQPRDLDFNTPSFVARVWSFPSLIKAQEFAQQGGVVIAEYSMVIRYVGSAESEVVEGSINIIEQIDAFMDAAAGWLLKYWRPAMISGGHPVQLRNTPLSGSARPS